MLVLTCKSIDLLMDTSRRAISRTSVEIITSTFVYRSEQEAKLKALQKEAEMRESEEGKCWQC